MYGMEEEYDFIAWLDRQTRPTGSAPRMGCVGIQQSEGQICQVAPTKACRLKKKVNPCTSQSPQK